MTKFLLKLVFVVIGFYLLLQMPFYKDLVSRIRTSFDEKVQNVGEEVTRVKGKIETAKEKIDQTKETVTNITNKVKDTTEAVEGVWTSLNEAQDTVDKMLNGEEGETVPEPKADDKPANEGGTGE
ncbi:hypothetical protein JW752_05525 [Candidatus Peregrinibacteria bacterium]|nr:hypothetical protein [Candidatus Peregrinibacteria bacterium]